MDQELIAAAAFLREANDNAARGGQYGRMSVDGSDMRRPAFGRYEFAALVIGGVLGCGIAYWFSHRY